MKGRKIFSDDQKNQIIEKVKLLKDQGMNLESACNENGITSKSFYNWGGIAKSKLSKVKKPRAKKAFVQDVEIHSTPPQQKVVCIIGSPAEIANVIRGIQ